jgi:hypothetical protein
VVTRIIIGNEHWYENVPKLTETIFEGNITILWNQQVQIDGTVTINNSEIIIRDNEKGTCVLIEAAISADRNVIKKEAEKILKCKDLTILILSEWDVIVRVTPVIMGPTGTISKSFQRILEQHTGKARN